MMCRIDANRIVLTVSSVSEEEAGALRAGLLACIQSLQSARRIREQEAADVARLEQARAYLRAVGGGWIVESSGLYLLLLAAPYAGMEPERIFGRSGETRHRVGAPTLATGGRVLHRTGEARDYHALCGAYLAEPARRPWRDVPKCKRCEAKWDGSVRLRVGARVVEEVAP